MTNYEGAHSRVQKAEALTPCDPAVWENWCTIKNNMADYVVVISSAFPCFFSLPVFLPNHFHSLHAKALGEKYVAKMKLYTRRLNTDTE